MSRAIHREFQTIAGELSLPLQQAIKRSGALQWNPRRERPLAEVLCRIITGQQLSVKAASTIWNRVVESAMEKPVIDHLAEVSPATLRRCGMSQSKAKAMKAIMQAERDGDLNVDQLMSLSHAERSARLTEIWGVGAWTADIVSISYFGDRDVWPDSDVTVWKTLERLTSRRRKTAKTAARFAPNRTFLALYMWKIADARPDK